MKSTKGFSLIEIIVAVSILVVMAGIAIPVVSRQADKAKASKMLSLGETLRKACEQYKSDTGYYPTEYSGAGYTGDQYHRLSVSQASVIDWDGPYLDHPLTVADNPYEGNVYMYSNLTGGSVRPDGFDLTGRGSVTHQNDGNFVGFSQIPQRVAELVDEALDKGIPGNWMTTGRVEFSNGNLSIYLCGGID